MNKKTEDLEAASPLVVHAENMIPMVNKCVRQTGTQAAKSDRQKLTQHVSDYLMKQSSKPKYYLGTYFDL